VNDRRKDKVEAEVEKKTKKQFLLLTLIVLAGFVLRVWGINFGLPFLLHQDEPIVVNHALAYGTGDLNPHFFAIPPLTSYLLFIIYGAYFLIGKLFGIFPTIEAFAISFLKDPSIFYILGRLFIGVIPGTLCVFFTFRLYKKLFNSACGALFSALIMAVSFITVSDSHYIYTDMLLCLFIIIAVIKFIDLWKNPCFLNYLCAGAFMGIACGIKYNAAVLIAPYAAAHFLAKKRVVSIKSFFAGVLASIIVFIVVNPFSLLDFRFFMNSIFGQAGASGYTGFSHHIVYSLYEGTGLFVLMCGFLGIMVMAVRDKAKSVIFLGFPVAFYAHLVFLSQHFPRYAVTLMPFFAISAGYFIFECIMPTLKKKLIAHTVIILSLLCILPTALKSVKANTLLLSEDIRIESAKWVEDNISINDPIACDHTFFRPFINQNEAQLKDKYDLINIQKGMTDKKKKKLDISLKTRADNKGYYMYYLSINPEAQGQFLSTAPSLAFDYESLKKLGVRYIIINYANRQEGTEAFYDRLKRESILVYSISPYYDDAVRFSYDTIATTCLPHTSKELFSRKRSGPAIEIYELK